MIEAGIPGSETQMPLKPSGTRRAGRFVRGTAMVAVLAAAGGCADARADVPQTSHASASNTEEVCSPKKIVVLGSSTAAGVGAEPKSNGWVSRYERHVKSLHPEHEVINLAIPGYTTYHALPNGSQSPEGRPAPDPDHNISAALSLKPDAIIVNLPSNDIASGYELNDIKANFEQISETAERENIPLWVATPQPRDLSEAKRTRLIHLKTWVREKFHRSLDFWSTLAKNDGTPISKYSAGDGVHMNNEGHKKITERVVESDISDKLCRSVTVLSQN